MFSFNVTVRTSPECIGGIYLYIGNLEKSPLKNTFFNERKHEKEKIDTLGKHIIKTHLHCT